MDEVSIQTLHADLTEDYHALVKSDTATIEQLLEEFNDDQMMFRFEAEAYEQERLTAMQTNVVVTIFGYGVKLSETNKPRMCNIAHALANKPKA